jgi:2-polyprenyl-3-methyl-5-hydroxy-6-metoxy-1,4-benzoquinol methylase
LPRNPLFILGFWGKAYFQTALLTVANQRQVSKLQPITLTRSRKQLMQKLLPYVEGSKTILDAGCGSGWLCECFKQALDASVVSVDIRKTPLKSNKNNPVQMDIRHLGFTETFDVVIAKDIIEHLVDPASAMREFASVLKPNGKIYIDCPPPGVPYFWDDYEHVRPYTKNSLAYLLDDTGFEIIYSRYLARPTFGAALFCYKGVIDALADKVGLRKGSLIAVARKKQV